MEDEIVEPYYAGWLSAAAASYRLTLALADQRSHFLFADRHIDGNVHLFRRDE